MPTLISGSTGVNKIQDGTIVNADINASAAIAGTKLANPGKVLQVVQAVKSSQSSYSAGAWRDIDLSVSLTATSGSSFRINTIVHTCEAYVNMSHSLKLQRSVDGGSWVDVKNGDNTAIREGTFSNLRTAASSAYTDILPIGGTYVDTPTYTSTVAYKVQAWFYNQTGYVNRNYRNTHATYDHSPISTLIVDELGA